MDVSFCTSNELINVKFRQPNRYCPSNLVILQIWYESHSSLNSRTLHDNLCLYNIYYKLMKQSVTKSVNYISLFTAAYNNFTFFLKSAPQQMHYELLLEWHLLKPAVSSCYLAFFKMKFIYLYFLLDFSIFTTSAGTNGLILLNNTSLIFE